MICLVSNLGRYLVAFVLGGGMLWWVAEHAGPEQGKVFVHVTEPRVTVLLDDEPFLIDEPSVAPIECVLPSGRHQLRMLREDRVLYEESFELNRGEEKILTAWVRHSDKGAPTASGSTGDGLPLRSQRGASSAAESGRELPYSVGLLSMPRP
jgi:hypothetical protein